MSHPYKSRPVAGTHVWLTPPWILEALGPFDTDPCPAPLPRPWDTAFVHMDPPIDGLTAEWRGRVWCNPPFGDQTWFWLEQLAKHGDGIALCFARTDTAGFQAHVWWSAHAVLFLKGRPRFHLPSGEVAKGNCGGPICLVAYGQKNADCLRECGLDGEYVQLMGYEAAA